jgi:hypothetical protein
MATLIIGNVNHTNEHLIKGIAGDAGYGGSVRLIDECTRRICLMVDNEDERAEVEQMIGRYALAGFDVKVQD